MVVLYGDGLMYWDEAVAVMRNADLILVVGCSLQTAPACYLPEMARANGADIIKINEQAEDEVPRLLSELGSQNHWWDDGYDNRNSTESPGDFFD